MKKLKTFDSGYFRGKSHFEEDGTQNYLLFQPIIRYLKTANANDNNYILSWKSEGLSDEIISSIKTTDYMLNPYFAFHNLSKVRVKFNGRCLKLDIPTLLHGGIVSVYIVYEITNNFNVSSYQILENCLFGAVKLTKSADIDKYGFCNYGNGFDRKGFFFTPF